MITGSQWQSLRRYAPPQLCTPQCAHWGAFTQGRLEKCGGSRDGCYSGIAAEIGAKNMPLAYFLNAPTGRRGRRPYEGCGMTMK
nr:MAG TPA_asm: hypothetical protein [Caudoviricetes sp.]